VKLAELKNRFDQVTTFLSALKLKYDIWKISGVSHLYGLWGFSYVCVERGMKPTEVKNEIHAFYDKYTQKTYHEGSFYDAYKQSMSSSTKSRTQRSKRIKALVEFCEVK
jgi:hypothetical protein